MAKDDKTKWIFPRRACPRCHSYDTIAVRTDSVAGKQYRKCRVPICRWTFCVPGEPAPDPDLPTAPVFACPHCGQTYERKSNLTKHVKKVHGGA